MFLNAPLYPHFNATLILCRILSAYRISEKLWVRPERDAARPALRNQILRGALQFFWSFHLSVFFVFWLNSSLLFLFHFYAASCNCMSRASVHIPRCPPGTLPNHLPTYPSKRPSVQSSMHPCIRPSLSMLYIYISINTHNTAVGVYVHNLHTMVSCLGMPAYHILVLSLSRSDRPAGQTAACLAGLVGLAGLA